MEKLKFILLFSFILMLVVSLDFETVAQCAMCKSTVESNQNLQGNARAEGLNAGILYLMVIPYVLFGTLAYFWYRNSKKEKATRDRVTSIIQRALGASR